MTVAVFKALRSTKRDGQSGQKNLEQDTDLHRSVLNKLTQQPQRSKLLTAEMEDEGKSPKYVLFDSIAFKVLTYLESFDEVCSIDFTANDPLKAVELNLWERKNAPYELPSDLKNLYALFNGFLLRWKVEVGDRQILIGEIRIHKIDQITPILPEGQFLPAEVSGLKILPPDPKLACAYLISICEEGQVVMLYRNRPSTPILSANSNSSPEIWLIDHSMRWIFLCLTFTQYLRLAVMHIGVIGWHQIFFPEGITSSTRQWMTLFCRERLCIYQYSRLQSSAAAAHAGGDGKGKNNTHNAAPAALPSASIVEGA